MKLTNNLDDILAKHNLALVPRSELTSTLSELTLLLKETRSDTHKLPLFSRQNGTTGDSRGGSSDGGSGQAMQNGLLDGVLDPLLGPIQELVDTLKAVQQLLTPEFLDALHDAMIYLQALLKPPFYEQARDLIAKAGPLIDLLVHSFPTRPFV